MKKPGKKHIFLTIFSITLLTILGHYLGLLKGIEQIFWTVLKPGSSFVYDIKVQMGEGDITKNFHSTNELKEAYKDLYKEVEQIAIVEAKNKVLEDENASLRDQLHFQRENKYVYKNATVIGKTTEAIGSSIIIDIGEEQKVNVGNPVVVGKGIFIGKVSRVEEDRAIVQLLNDSQSKVAASVMNQEKSLGIVEGGYGISVNMNFIPQNEKVSVGDTIITSGLEDYIPRGLIIGIVEATEKEPYKPFQTAILRPAERLENIHVVTVIISENRE